MFRSFTFSRISFGRILRLVLPMVLCVALGACHSSRKSVSPRMGKSPTRQELLASLGNVSGKQRRIVEEAFTWMGTPYLYAGADKGTGTDCSGMVLRIYEEVCGVKLPRNSAKQAEFCKKIKEKDVRTGDLVFFATGKDKNRISHVGIMINSEDFIHASSSKGVVVSKVTTPYYIRTFKQYGRVPM
ncbi:MAG: C40 family peptidase [Muribaculaceae bacterium]|nr:C40 family peptidase [Muribaculaceae bacterium]